MRIIRVFPRRTKATPTDNLAYVGYPDLFAQADEVHISVSFTWDIPEAERLAKVWADIAPVRVGGPAFNEPGGDFIPGQHLKQGYVITSRGCPNRCWFCLVWKREGQAVRELPITEGWLIQDDNLLACSEEHIRAVFAMLTKQCHPIEFTGGLEAALLQPWHVDLLVDLKPKQIFFAYDEPADYEPLLRAGKMLKEAGIIRPSSHVCRAYVLIGYPKDNFEDAEKRLRQVVAAGFMPMAMLWRNQKGEVNHEWRQFQRTWANPTIIGSKLKEAL